jgi:predicted nucleic acid-binding protein
MRVYIDATTLIALGNVGELDLLKNFDGELTVLPAVRREITTEPARSNVKRFAETDRVRTEESEYEEYVSTACDALGEGKVNGDVQIVAGVLAHDDVAVVSDDRRVRTVSEGFGATVTGTVGVVVRAVDEGMSADEAKEIIRRVDEHGLHMTAELRETAYRLIDGEGK